jgi:small conductance mechanosensitive channel
MVSSIFTVVVKHQKIDNPYTAKLLLLCLYLVWLYTAKNKFFLLQKRRKFMRYRVRAIVLTGVVCAFALWATPARTQEKAAEEAKVEKVQPPAGDPKFAVTTQDPTVPVDELQLLLKPLTLEELQNESAAWLILLKDKVQKISNAEIAIKRQNLSINKQKEASDSLDKSQESLKAAEEQLKTATPGSPEYEEATKKIRRSQRKPEKRTGIY